MADNSLLIFVFIDYDNLLPPQKTAGILDVVNKALVQVPWQQSPTRGRCEVRVYGGWYEGSQITRMAEELAIELHEKFPALLRFPLGNNENLTLNANAELAVSLLQEPAHHLLNTFRRKGKPSNVRVESPVGVGCSDVSCVLPQMKKLLKNGSCPKTDCVVTTCELVYRHEQKIVDTMLACDLIHAVDHMADWIVLVSGDDDFLPPLRTVLLSGTSAVRCYPRRSMQRTSFPRGGTQLVEVDL